MKVVAVDYDDTISDNEIGWLNILVGLEAIGYQVIIVTYRQPDCYPEDLQFIASKGYKVYFTGQTGKREYMLKNYGIHVHVWIDDTPESILFDHNPFTGFIKK